MTLLRTTIVLLIVSALFAVGCASQESDSLLGDWSAEGMMLSLRGDGTATWTIDMQTGPDPFELRYSIDYSREPHPFDLTGFDRGPLKDHALFGIVRFASRDTVHWHCEPGDAGGSGDELRPSDFDPEETRVLTRAR